MTVLDVLLLPELTEWYPVAGWTGLENSVARTAIVEVPDGPNFLEGSELVLSTGYFLKQNPSRIGDWFADVAQAGAAAVAMKFHRFLGPIPSDLLAQADSTAEPLIDVRSPTGWAPLVQAIHRRLLDKDVTPDVRAETLWQWLGTRCGVRRAVATVADRTGLRLTLHDRMLVPLAGVADSGFDNQFAAELRSRLAALRPSGPIALAAPTRDADPDGAHITCCPLRRYAQTVAWLICRGEEPLPPNQVEELGRWGRCLEIALPRLWEAELEQPITGSATGVSLAASARYAVFVHRLEPDDGVAYPLIASAELAAGMTADPQARRNRAATFPVAGGYAALAPVSPELALSPGDSRRQLKSMGLSLRTHLAKWYPDRWIRTGVSRLKVPESWQEGLAEAEHAARAAGAQGPVCFYEDIGLYRLLGGLTDHAALAAYCEFYLQPLVAFDRAHDGSLLQTLETYFACDGSIGRTARALHIHRNTLQYRLKKISELTRLNLNSLQSQSELHLAANIRRILG